MFIARLLANKDSIIKCHSGNLPILFQDFLFTSGGTTGASASFCWPFSHEDAEFKKSIILSVGCVTQKMSYGRARARRIDRSRTEYLPRVYQRQMTCIMPSQSLSRTCCPRDDIDWSWYCPPWSSFILTVHGSNCHVQRIISWNCDKHHKCLCRRCRQRHLWCLLLSG